MNTKRRPKARRSRTKKPKFLSLRLQFPAEKTKCIAAAGGFPAGEPITASDDANQQDQETVAYYFSAADGGDTTLTSLLKEPAAAPSISSQTTNDSFSGDRFCRRDDSASFTFAYGGRERKDGSTILRNAMKSRERDSSEEKWVCYSEVVERKVKEEVSSSSAVGTVTPRRNNQRLSLKLDYEEILNVWSNKGSLYVDSENSLQIVPDLGDDLFLPDSSSFNNGVVWGCNNMGSLWAVPEIMVDKIGQREASVLRYKEKRRNRFFSKKIRYQVRKLNAEKRPRLKGRFVKRN